MSTNKPAIPDYRLMAINNLAVLLKLALEKLNAPPDIMGAHEDGDTDAVLGFLERARGLEDDKARLLEAIKNALPSPEYLNDHDPIAVSTFKRIYRIIENATPPNPLAQVAELR